MFVTPGSRANRKRSPSITGGSLLPIVGNGLTVTTSTPLLDLTQTWNNAAVTFTGLKFNVTNTASAAGSMLVNLQVDATSYFNITRSNSVTSAPGLYLLGNSSAMTLSPYFGILGLINDSAQQARMGPTDITVTNGAPIGWASAGNNAIGAGADTIFTRTSAGVVGLKNSTTTTAASLQVYNTSDVTSGAPTNYERAVIDWTTTANTLTIGTQAGGTGTLRDLATVGSRWYFTGGAGVVLIGAFSNVVSFYGGWPIGWGAGAASNSIDTGLGRNAAGVVEINTGSLGTFGDLKARNYTGTGGTVTASTPVLDLTQTWNNAAVAFSGIRLNVTNTASSSSSKLFEILLGATNVFSVAINGNVDMPWGCTVGALIGANGGITIAASNNLAWGGQAVLVGEGTGILAQRWSTNPETFRVYNTYTDAANYERGIFDWTTTANTLTIGTQKGGTGTDRNVVIVAGTGATYTFATSGTATFPGISIQNNSSFISGRFVFSSGAMVSFADAGAIVSQASGVPTFADSSLAGATGWFQWGGQKRVTANFTSSTATLTAITGISSVGLQAGRNYAFKAWLAVTGSSLAGVQVGITCSSTTITTLLSDGYMHDAGVMRGSSVGVINSTGTPVVAVSSATVTSSNPSIRVDGMIRVASSGLFGLTVAQSTASATQVIVSSASYMIVYDMP